MPDSGVATAGTVRGDIEDAHTVAVRRAVAGWLIGQRSDQTRKTYERGLRQWIAWCDRTGVNWLSPERHELAVWMQQMGTVEKLAPDTIRNRASAVRSLLSEMTLCALRENRDPFVGLNMPRPAPTGVKQGLTDEQVRHLIATARGMRGQSETAVTVMAAMGLRASTTGALTGDEVQQTNWGPCLKVTLKGGKTALVPIPAIVQRAANRVGWPGAGQDRLGPGSADRARNRAAYLVKAVGDKAGIRVHPHQLRAYFVTAALEAGVPLHRVQRSVHHESASTTMGYLSAAQDIKEHAAHVVAKILDSD